MTELNRPRGTRDFGPDQMAVRRYAESEMRSALQSFGYNEVQTPTFEHLDLFVAKSGPQVVNQIYAFRDKGDRELALRPELTAPVMRFYQAELRNEPKPLRIFYFGNCFRYERPQKGRYREFWQMGLEYIGKRTALAYAEVISAAISTLRKVGLKGFSVRVGDVGLLRGVLGNQGIDLSEERDLAISLDKKETEKVRRTLLQKNGSLEIAELLTNTYSLSEAADVVDDLSKGAGEAVKEEGTLLKSLLDILKNSDGDEVLFDPSITRGLDYYDGIVFEIDVPSLGAEKQICGGGGYSMTSMFNTEVNGIGFGLGFDRIIMAIDDPEKARGDGVGIFYVIPIGERAERESMAIMKRIQKTGRKCILETQGRAVKKAISYGINCGADHVIIIGDAEINEGEISIKDLTNREQVSIPSTDLERYLNGI